MINLIKITNDLYDVAWRLKAIRDTYEIYYNAASCRYEVHDTAQFGNTLAFVVPYDELDCRTVSYALKTRRENADEIFEEIERDNERLEKSYYSKCVAATSKLIQ